MRISPPFLGGLLCMIVMGAFSCDKAYQPLAPDISTAPRSKTFTDWGEYLIDANDLVSVNCQNKNEVSGIYRVSPSGNITLPLGGVVRAKGLTESQLRDSIVLKLRPHLSSPRVVVSLSQLNSYVVYFTGRVQRPGTYRLESKTTLLQGLALAGGVASDSVNRVVIIRDSADGSKKRYETSYSKVRDGEALLDNFILERGDLVLLD